jgi:NAD(P)-dependent dehydrogenase (short-subunit alcohol dehydrogenase family)
LNKNVVITGSTRGIGFATADAFLGLGCSVTISGRSKEAVDKALTSLMEKHGGERIHGYPCDVTSLDQVQALWESAVTRFKTVDIWINNAGIGNQTQPLWEIRTDDFREILDTNVIGSLHGVKVAMKGMLEQGQGQIFNFEGYGSTDRIQYGLNAYGTSNAARTFFSKALSFETKDLPIQVGTIMPGMVMTDLVLNNLSRDPEKLKRIRPIFSIIGDFPENVGSFLARKILDNRKSGVRIRYLTGPKILWRILTAPFNKRDIFRDHRI